MKIDVVGSGSAYSTKSNTSSILVSDDSDNRWLIDCGPTVPRALFSRKMGINAIQVIYITHIHPDHCAGLPALINNWKSFKRTEPLTIFCQAEQKAVLQQQLALAHWPSDSLCFDVQWHDITDRFEWKNWRIETANTQHELPNKALSIEVNESKIFYSGDGRPTTDSIHLMKNADIAFQECASFEKLPESSSHGDFSGCKALLETTGIKQLGLYHCWDEYLPAIESHAKQDKRMFVSYDGLNIDLSD